MGMLRTKMNTRISVPLNDEEEERIQREIIQCTNIPYLENVGSSVQELQKKALEEAASLKTAKETSLTCGERAS